MKGLFDDDPAFKRKHRDRKGRFATEEHALYDKAIREHGYLSFLVEKYRRMAESATKISVMKDRQIAALKKKVAELQTQLNTQTC